MGRCRRGGVGPPATPGSTGCWRRYRESHRHYHGLAHVVRVLREVDDLLGAGHGRRCRRRAPRRVVPRRRLRPRAARRRQRGTPAPNWPREVLAELSRRPRRSRRCRAGARHRRHAPAPATARGRAARRRPGRAGRRPGHLRGVRPRGAAGVRARRRRRLARRAGPRCCARSSIGPRLFDPRPRHAREPRARANLAAELAGLRGPPPAATVARR